MARVRPRGQLKSDKASRFNAKNISPYFDDLVSNRSLERVLSSGMGGKNVGIFSNQPQSGVWKPPDVWRKPS